MIDGLSLKNCIGGLAKNVFFCGANENDKGPTLYTKDANTRSQLIELFQKRTKDDPLFGLIKVETTDSLKLKRTRSLEEILSRIPHDTIFFDPTATIERSKTLVFIAKQARQLLGSMLKGCYFNSEKRNIYFQVKAKNSTDTLDLAAIQKQLEPIILNNTKRLTHPFYYTITISVQKPQGVVVAVDKASVVEVNLKGFMKAVVNKLKWPLLLVSATSSLGIAAKAATDVTLPAVSQTNGWLGAAGDYLHNQRNSGAGAIGEGGIAAPLAHDLGAQLHGYAGSAGGTRLLSIDGYIFWRNPAEGLLGPHITYINSGGFHETFYGLHGEAYLNNWTLTGEGGAVAITGGSNNSGAYGEAIINWYALPDWRLYAGGVAMKGSLSLTGQAGTEYQFGLSSLPGLAIFADAGIGAHDMRYGFLGLRYYFGDIKSLVRRHREDMVPPTFDPIARAKRVFSRM